MKFKQVPDTIIIRCLVGLVFLSEGIQKFLFPELNGAGRFLKLGIPYPFIIAPLVSIIEITSSLFILIGFWTRYAAVPLLAVIFTAIALTKIQILTSDGFWTFAHESRTDYCMVLGLWFLLLYGDGKYSFDNFFKIIRNNR